MRREVSSASREEASNRSPMSEARTRSGGQRLSHDRTRSGGAPLWSDPRSNSHATGAACVQARAAAATAAGRPWSALAGSSGGEGGRRAAVPRAVAPIVIVPLEFDPAADIGAGVSAWGVGGGLPAANARSHATLVHHKGATEASPGPGPASRLAADGSSGSGPQSRPAVCVITGGPQHGLSSLRPSTSSPPRAAGRLSHGLRPGTASEHLNGQPPSHGHLPSQGRQGTASSRPSEKVNGQAPSDRRQGTASSRPSEDLKHAPSRYVQSRTPPLVRPISRNPSRYALPGLHPQVAI